MRCREVRRLVSAAADGEISARDAVRLDVELARCDDCRRFAEGVHALRSVLRFEVLEHRPGVADRVTARLADRRADPVRPPSRRRRLVPLAAAVFAAGFAAGAVFVGLGSGPQSPARALDIGAAVLDAQRKVATLSARIEIIEHGLARDVPRRTFAGTLRYASPESFALRLRDTTRYPDRRWVPNDVALVVAGDRAWSRALRSCPREALPGCLRDRSVVRVVDGREPFAASEPIPLDVVVPVRSFAAQARPVSVVEGTVAGRRAVGLSVSAAQVEPLLDGLRGAGVWRDLAPSDPVELWLDAGALVPLRLTVRAGAGSDRAEWAARHGYTDRPGDTLLTVTLHDVAIDAPLPRDAFPPPPSADVRRTAAFTADASVAMRLTPAALPTGMRLARAGRTAAPGAPVVEVAAWTDGRAWLKVQRTDGWREPRLFGDLGDVVRRLPLDGGVGYADESGGRVAVHGDGADVVVSGSLGEAVLARVASTLGVAGLPVPAGWAESGAITVADLARIAPRTLIPRGLQGFAEPAVQAAGGRVVLAFAGPGGRGFRLVEEPGRLLGPPPVADVRAVAVRGSAGRWTPSLRTLEWVEGGRVVTLASRTLELGELLAVARTLGPA
jgi:hypothetical protein